MVEHLLKEIGLKDNEVKIYLTLLKNKRLTYAQLSDVSTINRTTCYGVVKKLIIYGLADEDLASPVVQIVPLPATNLVEKLGKEQAKLIKQIEVAKRATTELEKIIPKGQFIEPKINYIEDEKIENYLYQRCTTWDKSMHNHDSTMWGFESGQFEQQFVEYIRWYWTRPIAQGISLKFFSDNPDLRNTDANARGIVEFRYCPGIVNFATSVWVMGDFVVMLSLQEKPRYILEIQEPLLARNLREFFKVMWQTTDTLWQTHTRKDA